MWARVYCLTSFYSVFHVSVCFFVFPLWLYEWDFTDFRVIGFFGVWVSISFMLDRRAHRNIRLHYHKASDNYSLFIVFLLLCVSQQKWNLFAVPNRTFCFQFPGWCSVFFFLNIGLICEIKMFFSDATINRKWKRCSKLLNWTSF